MMVKLKIFILIIFLNTIYSAGQNTENEKLAGEINVFIKNFEKVAQLSEDGILISPRLKDDFRSVFVPGALVINDLIPDNPDNEKISVEAYLVFVEEWYKNGFSVNVSFQKIDIGKVQKVRNQEHTYSVWVKVNKELVGLYKEQKFHKYNKAQWFKLQYKEIDGQITEMKISEISKTEEKEKKLTTDNKGIFIGTSFTVQIANLSVSKYIKEGISSNSAAYEISSGIETEALIKYPWRIGVGLLYTVVKGELEMTLDHYSSSILLNDIDNDNYYPVYTGNYKYNLSYGALSVPVKLIFNAGPAEKLNFRYSFGIVPDFITSSKQLISGAVEYMGYYPEYPVVLYDIPEYNFYYNPDINEKTEWLDTKINISVFSELGLNIPVGGIARLNICGVVLYGISDLTKQNPSNINDINFITGSRENTNVISFGINSSLVFKIK